MQTHRTEQQENIQKRERERETIDNRNQLLLISWFHFGNSYDSHVYVLLFSSLRVIYPKCDRDSDTNNAERIVILSKLYNLDFVVYDNHRI